MFNRKTTTTLATTILATALAALVLGPSAGAATMPISSCGQVVTTNAVLTQDLTCAGPGVIVGASGVTIDLNGHVLKGDGTAGHYGIDNKGGYDDFVVKNGVVRNFDTGVYAINYASGQTVSSVVASGNVGQGIYISGPSAKIASSTAAGNGQTGIHVLVGPGSVTKSSASGNGLHGIWMEGTKQSVKSSTAVGNAGYGIVVSGDAASVTSASANGNKAVGIRVVGSLASIKSSTTSGNGGHGIYVSGDAATLKANRAEGNSFPGGVSDDAGFGIVTTGFTTPPAGTNVARGNDQSGECLPASLCPVANSKVNGAALPISFCEQTVTTDAYLTKDLFCPGDTGVVVGASGITIDLSGHVVKGDGLSGHYGIDDQAGYDKVTIKNGVVRNFDNGVYAVGGADNLAVSNLVASGNTHAGVRVDGASAKVASSTVAGNGTNGIELDGDSASVTSSTAAENGGKGISMFGAGPSIKSSSVAGNDVTGIFVSGNSAKVTSTTAFGNGASGLFVGGNSASIESTTASGNQVYGINLSGDQGALKGNRADGNGFAGGVSDGFGVGIRVENFITAPVGTNLARGNDDPAECVPGSLC